MKRRSFLKGMGLLSLLPFCPVRGVLARPVQDRQRAAVARVDWHHRPTAPGCASPVAGDDTGASFEKCLPEFLKRRE